MKTSSIALRVADFLKEHPPFEYMDVEDVQRLAASGRVKFHEAGEYVFRQGEERGPWLYVVQQGTVRVVQNTPGGEELVDMRGVGDLLGVSWFLSEKLFVHSALTDTDTLLYALPWNEFAPLVRKYPQVSRYLAAYFSLRPDFQLPDPLAAIPGPRGSSSESADTWLAAASPLAERARERLVTAPPGVSVREAARQLAAARQDALVVADADGRPVGIITETDLVRRAATGEVPLDAPVEAIMSRPVLTARPGLNAGEVVLHMLRHRLRHLVVTRDGTPATAAEGLVAERDVQVLFGRLPLALGREIQNAAGVAALARVRGRAEELLRAMLRDHEPLSWLAEFVSEMDAQITRRVLELAEAGLANEGSPRPAGAAYCWLAVGAEGRKERLLRDAQETALIFADPPRGQVEAVRGWMLRLARRASEALAELGFRESLDGLSAAQPACCHALGEWRDLFAGWIKNPIIENILARLPLFDFRALHGDFPLAAALREHIAAAIAAQPRFVALVANDSLASLPPLTIFQNSVMDKEGLLWACIDTRQHALNPLVDTARVFAFAEPGADPLSTSARFLAAARRLPAQRALFEDAAEAVRVALCHQALAGFRHADNGQFIRPAELSKSDLEVVKGVFRTIVQVAEFTARHFGLTPGVETPEPEPEETEETAPLPVGAPAAVLPLASTGPA